MMKIVIITPARNEEEYVRETIESIIQQTVKPIRWIIVDDGSTDKTVEIIENYTKDFSFMELLKRPNRGFRRPGEGVIESFYEGYNLIKNIEYEIVAKLDADLKFPNNTLELIVNAFEKDKSLGITGGTRYEEIKGKSGYQKIFIQKGYVGGAYKFYRRECFYEIGGIIHRAGWDGVDIVKANMKGWKTGELKDVRIIHLRPTGTSDGEGLKRACMKYGDISYYMGGHFWYFLLRVVGRSILNSNYKTGFYMLKGYLNSKRNKLERESRPFRKFLKKTQRDIIRYHIKNIIQFKIDKVG